MESAVRAEALPRANRISFYIVVAVVALIIALGGFSATYVIPMIGGAFVSRPAVHIHGAMYFLWLLVFIGQPWLVYTKKVKIHRKVGVFGFILAGCMVVMGLVVAITGARLNSPALTTSGLPAKQFLLIPLTDMLLFATFIGLSLANLKRGDTHKRLMVLATSAILPAAFARLLPLLGIQNIPALLLLSELLVVLAIINDLITRRKIHKVYVWGGAAMAIVHFVRFPIAGSAWWASLSDWFV